MIYSRICKISLVQNPRLEQTKFVHQHLTLLRFFPIYQYATFYQSLVNADFLNSLIGPNIQMKVFEVYIIFVWVAWKKNKGFQSGNLLK